MQVDKQPKTLLEQEIEKLAAHNRVNESFTRANDGMIGGTHYKDKDAIGTCPHCRKEVEHWDWSHNLRGLEYAATKYIARWRDKGGLESLKKAIHYIQKLIEIHFPGVVITVQYSNRTTIGGNVNSGIGGQEVEGSSGLAGGQTSHQAAVESEKERYARVCREAAARVKGDIF